MYKFIKENIKWFLISKFDGLMYFRGFLELINGGNNMVLKGGR